MCPALRPADRDGFDLAFLAKHVNVHPKLCAPVPGTLSEVTGRDVQSWNRHQVSHRTPGDAPAREGRRRQRYGPTCSRPHWRGRRGGLRELSTDTEVPREQHVSLRSPKERDDPFSRCCVSRRAMPCFLQAHKPQSRIYSGNFPRSTFPFAIFEKLQLREPSITRADFLLQGP